MKKNKICYLVMCNYEENNTKLKVFKSEINANKYIDSLKNSEKFINAYAIPLEYVS